LGNFLEGTTRDFSGCEIIILRYEMRSKAAHAFITMVRNLISYHENEEVSD
jgi:hypothetical protein